MHNGWLKREHHQRLQLVLGAELAPARGRHARSRVPLAHTGSTAPMPAVDPEPELAPMARPVLRVIRGGLTLIMVAAVAAAVLTLGPRVSHARLEHYRLAPPAVFVHRHPRRKAVT